MYTIKDCLFGQIRAVDDNVYRGTGIPKTALPTTIPTALEPFVTEQQVITWDNTTGMNPLWHKSPIDNTAHKSYGEMLNYSYELSLDHGLTFMIDLIPYCTADEYNALIKRDHTSDYALLCASLGFWWHIHLFLTQAESYDYTALRQHDTWYYPELKEHHVAKIFDADPTIPTMFVTKINTINYPTTAFIQAFFYMLNREAVDQLKDDFYVLILKEVDRYYKLLNKNAQQIYGKSGVILHNVCVKNNIDIINIDQLIGEIYCWIPTARSPDCKDYGRSERNVGSVNFKV